MTDPDLQRVAEYLNHGRHLSRIATAAESIAGVKGEETDRTRERRSLASAMLFGSHRDAFAAMERVGNLERLAEEEARIAAINTSMHKIGSETLDGKPYHEPKFELPEGITIKNPASIQRYLDGVVLAQPLATRVMSISITDLYYRILAAQEKTKVLSNIEKNNLVFIGPSGVGKTLLAYNAANLIALPVVKVAATSLAPIDGRGVNIADVLREYCKVDVYSDKSGKQERRLSLRTGAEYGFLVIDEIDKLAGREKLQHELLPILEKGEYKVGDGVSLEAANLTTIATGAFNGIEGIIRRRLGAKNFFSRWGDTPSRAELLAQVTEKDLVEYGFIPELARRFQGYVPFAPLSEEGLYEILTKPKDSLLSQYKSRFQLRGFEFEAEESALRAIARYSARNSEGANGLKTGFLKVTEDLLFQPAKYQKDKKIFLTEQHARQVLGV